MTQGPAIDTTPDLICPHCGYDLRLLTSERCPECGQAIDRNVDQLPTIPWSHRRTRGRIKTYLQTVWMVTLGTRKLIAEQSRPVSYSDARRFWIVTSIIVSLPLVALLLYFWCVHGGVPIEAPSMLDRISKSAVKREDQWITYDVAIPWQLGMNMVPLTILLVPVLVFTNLGIPTYFTIARSSDAAVKARSIALAYYLCGTLFWWPAITLASLLGALALVYVFKADPSENPAELMVLIAFWGGYALTLLLYWIRCSTLSAVFTRGGCLGGFLTALTLPMIWTLNTGIWAFVVPWVCGYLWILAGSW